MREHALSEREAALLGRVHSWQKRATVSWLGLAGLLFATCANYSSTDEFVARQKVTIGQGRPLAQIEGGIITLTDATGRKAEVSATGIRFLDAAGKQTGSVAATAKR